MRHTRTLSMSVILLLVGTVTFAQEKPWFDSVNCAFCKLFAAQPGLLDHMTTEYHNISDGLVSVTHIDKGYEDGFKKAQAGIGNVLREMQTTGKMPYSCPHCTMIGEFQMSGVRMEAVNSDYGIINLYTSSDTAMVAKIQDFGKRSAEAQAKAKESKKAPVQDPKNE